MGAVLLTGTSDLFHCPNCKSFNMFPKKSSDLENCPQNKTGGPRQLELKRMSKYNWSPGTLSLIEKSASANSYSLRVKNNI